MPVDKYFKGSGDKVMGSMTKEYGPKKGKEVFYATANKQGMKPSDGPRKSAFDMRKFGGKASARISK